MIHQPPEVGHSVLSPHLCQDTVTAALNWNMQEGVDTRMRENGSHLLMVEKEREGGWREGEIL